MTRRQILLTVALLACTLSVGARQGQLSSDESPAFEGSWSATGIRQTLPTETDREAVIVHLSGAVVLRSDGGLGRGFHGQVIGFDDGRDVRVGRAVWTDERGDRIYSELTGGPVLTGQRVVGTITGGTGRYAGLAGEYTFTWQYVAHAPDGAIQGRTVGLTGRVQRAPGEP